MKFTLTVNRKRRTVDVPPMQRLLDTLRETLGLTGTKEGCGEGECGACCVLLDGAPVNSCLLPTCQATGVITTIEGIGTSKRLHRMQKSFLECGGAQCGICTPGMIMTASTLRKRSKRREIQVALAGNLCRCTGYMKIYDAVERASHSAAAVKRARPRQKAQPKRQRG